MNTSLDTNLVVAWLREQSTRFANIADEIEAVFGSTMPLGTGQTPTRIGKLSNSPPTPDEVKSHMVGRSVRVSSLAKHMGVLESVLESVMIEANGFVHGERGWISLPTNNSQTAEHRSNTLSEGGEL